MPRNTLAGAAQPPHQDSLGKEGHHGLREERRQGPQEVGGWREALIVAAFLIFSVIVFGLASLSGK